ncbi:MAG: hypothetical protein WC406_02820 [Methanoregula sp.]|jgi:hypothetical protein
MMPIYRVPTLLLLVVCVLLTAGCGVQIDDGKNVRIMNQYSITSQIPTPTAIPIPSTPFPPSGYWIKIETISNKQVGEIFTINSTTNLSVGDKILVQIYQADFHPGIHPIGEEFHGIVGTVNVIPGRNEINTISFIVNSSELYLYPLEYRIAEEAIYTDLTGKVQSNVTGEARFKITQRKTL